MGFFREGNATVYREWCPAASSAQLIGDFNAWGGSWMERDAYGVWKITLPDGAVTRHLHQRPHSNRMHASMLLSVTSTTWAFFTIPQAQKSAGDIDPVG